MLRSMGLHVPPPIAAASALREKAQLHSDSSDFAQCEACAREALAALDGSAVLAGSVVALRLRHRIQLLRAAAARELYLDATAEGDIERLAEVALACAEAARAIQERLARAHAAGPCATHLASGPRLVPALLLAAQAHVALSETGRANSAHHRGEAIALLCALERPPYEPPNDRFHRVRAKERRQIAEALHAARDAAEPPVEAVEAVS